MNTVQITRPNALIIALKTDPATIAALHFTVGRHTCSVVHSNCQYPCKTNHSLLEIFRHTKARFTKPLIIAVLKSVEAGRTVKDVCREAGISEQLESEV
jgi:putative transposase